MYYLGDAQSSVLICPFVKRMPMKISFAENKTKTVLLIPSDIEF